MHQALGGISADRVAYDPTLEFLPIRYQLKDLGRISTSSLFIFAALTPLHLLPPRQAMAAGGGEDSTQSASVGRAGTGEPLSLLRPPVGRHPRRNTTRTWGHAGTLTQYCLGLPASGIGRTRSDLRIMIGIFLQYLITMR